ncbi:MAG: hypothetical protein JO321_16530 [Solirubrobacterales bacterium]|nr:hypothetical protein [Solirubrobacterales bacterium]
MAGSVVRPAPSADAPGAQRALRGEVTIPDGVRVILLGDTWSQHILATKRHPDLAPHLDSVLATVESPDHREPDDRPQRERFYKQDVGPGRWLMVIVDFEESRRGS